MDENDYLENRIKDQINFYENKSKLNKNCYYVSKFFEICSGVSIPLISGHFMDKNWAGLVIAILGVLIAISASMNGVIKYQEKWIYYRTTIEQLKREREFFLTRTGVYLEKELPSSFNLFVENCENIMSSENNAWKKYQQSKITINKK
ncbi:DUF4231 domain-containing protein [Treponema sp. Marseille-Q4130]|uniref:DUF4231 domain-containing protein n=1 Tax=Treponema sp. Marseille-Q4130 TaxID=2766702 RepID=UPI001652A654|nr:DUF4231 domain-containing protein [Treponema sp. Marseille-Q4130]MBC6721369.1 DUF4231 domain-containing protein [Treponema sp. Marseille-Q4130]